MDYPRSHIPNEHPDPSPLAKANAIAERIRSKAIGRNEIVPILLEFASACDAIVPRPDTRLSTADDLMTDVAPAAENANPLRCEPAAARQNYRRVARELLNRQPTESLVSLVAELVATATNGGRLRPSALIDDIVNEYETAAQAFMDGESFNVRKLLALIRLRIARGDWAKIKDLAEQLRNVLLNWARVTGPIQMICRGKGLDHLASRSLAREVASLAAELEKANAPPDATVAIMEGLARETALIAESSADLIKAPPSAPATSKDSEDSRRDAGELQRGVSYSAEVGVLFRRRLEISDVGLAWKGNVYRHEEITGLRWGACMAMDRVPIRAPFFVRVQTSSNYAVFRLWGADTFSAVVDRLWRFVGIRLLFEYGEQLKSGGRIVLPGVIIEDDTVALTPKKWFRAGEATKLSWNEVLVLSSDKYLTLSSRRNSGDYVTLSYAKLDNVRIIEEMIGQLVASGKASISALRR